MDDLISRATALRCIMQSRENIDWGQSDDGDAMANHFLTILKANECRITREEFLTLRAQAVHGDVEGANDALEALLRRGAGCRAQDR